MNFQLTSPQSVQRITLNVLSIMAFATAAHADIFQWEYVDPADPSLGKRQSTLAPGGAFAVTSPYVRKLCNLYTTGQVTLTTVLEPATCALAAVSAFSLTLYRRRKMS